MGGQGQGDALRFVLKQLLQLVLADVQHIVCFGRLLAGKDSAGRRLEQLDRAECRAFNLGGLHQIYWPDRRLPERKNQHKCKQGGK